MRGIVGLVNVDYVHIFPTDREGNHFPNTKPVFCHISQMPMDEVGRRYLCPREEVEFEIGEGRGGKSCAVDVELVVAREPVAIDDYWEDGQVGAVRSGYAFVKRPYGGLAFLHKANVQQGSINFVVGQWWRYKVECPVNPEQSWLAMEAIEMVEDDSEAPAHGGEEVRINSEGERP